MKKACIALCLTVAAAVLVLISAYGGSDYWANRSFAPVNNIGTVAPGELTPVFDPDVPVSVKELQTPARDGRYI